MRFVVEDIQSQLSGTYQGIAATPRGTLFVCLYRNSKNVLFSYSAGGHENYEELSWNDKIHLCGCDFNNNLYFLMSSNRIGIRRQNAQLEVFERTSKDHIQWRNLVIRGNTVYCMVESAVTKVVFDNNNMKYAFSEPLSEKLITSPEWDIDEQECCYLRTIFGISKYNIHTKQTSQIAVTRVGEYHEWKYNEEQHNFQIPIGTGEMKYHRGYLFVSVGKIIGRLDLKHKNMKLIGNKSFQSSLSLAPNFVGLKNALFMVACSKFDKSYHTYRVDMGEPWQVRRLLWIGKMKGKPRKCKLALLPVEIIRHIDSYL